MNVDVTQLSDLPSVMRVIEQVNEDEIALETEIKNLTSKKGDIDIRLKELNCSVPDFGMIKTDSCNLTHMITSASDLAMELSGKIRQLDLVKNRVQTCVSLLDDVINLKEFSTEADIALKQEKYEEAAVFVSKSLIIGHDVFRISERISSDVGARESVSRLNGCREHLVSVTEQKVNSALSRNDYATVERFCKLYPLLGKHDEGLKRFGSYLCALIGNRGHSFIKLAELAETQSPADGDNTGCLDLLTQIFEFVAETLRDKQPYVETHFGPGNLFQITSTIQNECDRLISQVHTRFKTQHRLSELMSLVQPGLMHTSAHRWSTATNPLSGGTTNTGSMVSSSSSGISFDKVLALEPIISDIVLLNTRTELYMRFVRRRITADLNNATGLSDSERDVRLQAAAVFFDNCQTLRLMQDLIGTYITLERFYLQEMVIKAVGSDELDDSTKSSRFADDIFFILKQCLSRSLSSGSVDGICAMLNHACSSLKDHLLTNTLVSRIRTGFPSGWMQDAYSYMQSSVAAVAPAAASSNMGVGVVNSTTSTATTASGPTSSGQAARQQFLITLNTVEACLANLSTFSSLMAGQVASLFAQPDDDVALRKIQACLNELNHSISDQLKRLLDTGLDELTTSVIRGQAKAVVQPFQSVQYTLSEDDLDVYSTNDPWIETCISDLEKFISPFRSVLSSGNNDRFVSVLATELVRRLELLIQRKTYNRFGAVQLEKEVRCLFAYLASITYTALRDHFTRLLQMCNLLNVEKVEEVSFYWSASTWRLSPKEVRRVLALRSDFSAEDIRRVKL